MSGENYNRFRRVSKVFELSAILFRRLLSCLIDSVKQSLSFWVDLLRLDDLLLVFISAKIFLFISIVIVEICSLSFSVVFLLPLRHTH